MIELLNQNVSKHINLSDNEIDGFYKLFKSEKFKKKEYLLREGETCKFEGFVIKGLFRVFHIDNNGIEQVLYFAMQNWWITDLDSFTNEKPSNLYIQGIRRQRSTKNF